MMTLVIGGSGSGKSAYAENCAEALSGGKQKYYIATMQIYDREGQKKVERHRRLRDGKGFVTIEQPRAVWKAFDRMECGEKTVLLECLSNLVANEMFAENTPKQAETVAGEIVRGIGLLKEKLTHLVVVGNNVFEDGKIYDTATMEYLRAMGSVQRELAYMADEVIEVVAGIPIVVRKGG